MPSLRLWKKGFRHKKGYMPQAYEPVGRAVIGNSIGLPAGFFVLYFKVCYRYNGFNFKIQAGKRGLYEQV